MATEAQINANRENSTHSTGPITPEGQATSSRNHTTNGLFTREDHVERTERDIYREFCQRYRAELDPENHIEATLASEIISAAWRLRRCNRLEHQLDFSPIDAETEIDTDREDKTRRSIERARAAAHRIFLRSLNQFNKLQVQRLRAEQAETDTEAEAEEAEAFLSPEEQTRREARLERARQLRDEKLASNCKTPEQTPEPPKPARVTRPITRNDAPRNAPCPCGSGIKFKRCCIRKAA